MTVGDLKELLDRFPDDMEVFFSSIATERQILDEVGTVAKIQDVKTEWGSNFKAVVMSSEGDFENLNKG